MNFAPAVSNHHKPMSSRPCEHVSQDLLVLCLLLLQNYPDNKPALSTLRQLVDARKVNNPVAFVAAAAACPSARIHLWLCLFPVLDHRLAIIQKYKGDGLGIMSVWRVSSILGFMYEGPARKVLPKLAFAGHDILVHRCYGTQVRNVLSMLGGCSESLLAYGYF